MTIKTIQLIIDERAQKTKAASGLTWQEILELGLGVAKKNNKKSQGTGDQL